jgi:hypothetical protein
MQHRLETQCRAIDVGKVNIAFVEKRREVGSRQNDGVDSITLDKRGSQSRQVPALLI